MVRSVVTRAKIARGVKAYHSACARAMDNAPISTRRSKKAPLKVKLKNGKTVTVKPRQVMVLPKSVKDKFNFAATDRRLGIKTPSKRGKAPGRKGKAPRKRADGKLDRRFKGSRGAPARPPPPSRSAVLRAKASILRS